VFKYWHHVLLLSIEAHCVITMRAIKLASGGTSALDEAWHILAEKTTATAEIPHMLFTRSPLMLAMAYRKLVRSNLRRLSARHKGSGAGRVDSFAMHCHVIGAARNSQSR
jgi:hypothetical protein